VNFSFVSDFLIIAVFFPRAGLHFARVCTAIGRDRETRRCARSSLSLSLSLSRSRARARARGGDGRASSLGVLFAFRARTTGRNVGACTETHYAACIFINGSASSYVRAFLLGGCLEKATLEGRAPRDAHLLLSPVSVAHPRRDPESAQNQ